MPRGVAQQRRWYTRSSKRATLAICGTRFPVVAQSSDAQCKGKTSVETFVVVKRALSVCGTAKKQ
jgi:hypothetical protein